MKRNEPVCPQCGSVRKGTRQMTNTHLPKDPEPGDLMVCHKCSGLGVFTEDGTRKPTAEEMSIFLDDDTVIAAILAVRAANDVEEMDR